MLNWCIYLFFIYFIICDVFYDIIKGFYLVYEYKYGWLNNSEILYTFEYKLILFFMFLTN